MKFFYFQNIEHIITNLDNYKDYTHYSKEISYKIALYMRNGDYQLTKENLQEEIYEMRQLLKNFDYEQFFS